MFCPGFAKLRDLIWTMFLITPKSFYEREQWLGRHNSNRLICKNTRVQVLVLLIWAVWLSAGFFPPLICLFISLLFTTFSRFELWFLHLKNGENATCPYPPHSSMVIWFKTWWHFKNCNIPYEFSLKGIYTRLWQKPNQRRSKRPRLRSHP